MAKLTLLYGHPDNSAHFEIYYLLTHLELVNAMKGVKKYERTRFPDIEGLAKSRYYGMDEFWFSDLDALHVGILSIEGKAMMDNLESFPTDDITVMIGIVE